MDPVRPPGLHRATEALSPEAVLPASQEPTSRRSRLTITIPQDPTQPQPPTSLLGRCAAMNCETKDALTECACKRLYCLTHKDPSQHSCIPIKGGEKRPRANSAFEPVSAGKRGAFNSPLPPGGHTSPQSR